MQAHEECQTREDYQGYLYYSIEAKDYAMRMYEVRSEMDQLLEDAEIAQMVKTHSRLKKKIQAKEANLGEGNKKPIWGIFSGNKLGQLNELKQYLIEIDAHHGVQRYLSLQQTYLSYLVEHDKDLQTGEELYGIPKSESRPGKSLQLGK